MTEQQGLPTLPKRKRRKWPWITLGSIVAIGVIVLGMTGIGHIPVVSSLFGASKPKDLGVHPTVADLSSVQAKTPLRVIGEPSAFSVFSEKKYTGSVPVDNSLTSAELTAWVQHFTKTDSDVRDIQVKFREGGLEISAFAERYINAPIYVDADVRRTGPTSVVINIRKGKVGAFRVPDRYLESASTYFQRVLNEHLRAIPGFSMDDLQYHNGFRTLKGSYPATVEPSTGSWW